MEGKPIDIDRDNLNTGSTVHIFNYLDDNWKAAVVQEIDLTEREILVDYEDGTQEWIGVDGRKICFPPTEQPVIPLTPVTTKRRASSSKIDTENPTHTKKSKSSASRIADTAVKKIKSDSLSKNVAKKIKSDSAGIVNKVKQNLRKSVPKSHAKSLNKTDLDKKDMSKPISAFMRLQFKSNHKTSKANGKFDMKKQKRIRQEQFRPQNLDTDSVSGSAEQLAFETIIKRSQTKTPQPRSKDLKKDIPKLKIKIGRNHERISEQADFSCERVAGGTPELSKKKLASKRELSASDTSVQSNERMDTSFTITGEKKIKTLFPKRSAPEPLLKPATSPSCPVTPESPSGLSSSLSSIYPTANVLPLTLTASSSGFYCPKQDCKKPCRNENMLMMHIKHYHSEYRDMFSSMPNVADLAYKRTVGENIESSQAGFLERITKLEEDRLKEKSADDVPMISQTAAHENTTDEKSTTVIENPEKMTDFLSKSNVRHACKKPPPSKRLSNGSAPSSPKLSVLVAQLQEPPLVPPSISIQSEHTDTEFSVSQNKPVSVYSPQLSDQSNSLMGNSSPPIDSDEKQEDGKKSSPTKKRRLSQLDSTDVINCLCGYGLEDGLMIQCDLCQCWQHGACMSFENESDVPSNYVCETCQFPRRHHSSRKYCYVQNWLKEGRLANFQFSHPREETARKREQFLKQSHEFLCNLTELKYAVRSLQVKIQILRQTPDHPKLYLWAKSWNKDASIEKGNQSAMIGGPIPEDAINMADCRKHLFEHIEEEMKKAELMLRNIEGKIEKLDELDIDDGEEDGDSCNNPEKYTSVAKQTLLMLLRDLVTIHTLKYC